MWLYVFSAFTWWFWYFCEDIMQINDVLILLESRIIPQFLTLMQIIYICYFWLYKFSIVLAQRHFIVLMMLFVWYIKIMFTIFCITKKVPWKYDSMFVMFFIWWYHVVIHTLKSPVTPVSKCFCYIMRLFVQFQF